MYIRKRKYKSGHTGVFVKDNDDKTLLNLGCVAAQPQIEELERRGRRYIAHQTATESHFFPDALKDLPRDEKGALLDPSVVQQIGPELLFGTLSDIMALPSSFKSPFRPMVVSRALGGNVLQGSLSYLCDCLQERPGKTYVDFHVDTLCHTGFAEQLEKSLLSWARKMEPEMKEVPGYCLLLPTGMEAPLRSALLLLLSPALRPLALDTIPQEQLEPQRFLEHLSHISSRSHLPLPVLVLQGDLLKTSSIRYLEKNKVQVIRPYRMPAIKDSLSQQVPGLGSLDSPVLPLPGRGRRLTALTRLPSCAQKDAAKRQAAFMKASEKLEKGKVSVKNLNSRGSNRYFMVSKDGSIQMNTELFQKESLWDGVRAFSHDRSLDAVLASRGYLKMDALMDEFMLLDEHVAEAFVPQDRIQGLVMVRLAALAVKDELSRRLSGSEDALPAEKIPSLLKGILRIRPRRDGKGRAFILDMSAAQEQLLFSVLPRPRKGEEE